MQKGRQPKFRGMCSRCGGERNRDRRYCKPCEATLARGRYARQKRLMEIGLAHLEAIAGESGEESGRGNPLPEGKDGRG